MKWFTESFAEIFFATTVVLLILWFVSIAFG